MTTRANPLEPRTVPTLYFVGVTTTQSSIMKVFPKWSNILDLGAEIIGYDATVEDALSALRNSQPRYTCFVAPPEEVTREFVASVHRLTRKLDEDPYTDTIWGILTGYDAENALRQLGIHLM